MSKNVGKNYLLYLSNQLLGIITPFITTPYISRVLHVDGIGVVSYVGAISAYFILIAGLGVGTYGQRELSYLQNNRVQRSVIFSNLVCINSISTLIACLSYLYFCMLQEAYNTVFYIYTIQVLAVGADISWLFVAMEDFFSVTLRSVLVRVLSVICIFMFVSRETDVYIYALIVCFSSLFGNIVLWVSFRKYVDFSTKYLNPQRYIKGIFLLFIPTIAISIYTQMDKIMLGYMTNDLYQVGCYEQSMKILRILLWFVVSLGMVFVPRIGDLLANKQIDAFKRVVRNNMGFVLFSGMFIFFELNAVIVEFVPIFFGSGFDDVVYIINALSLDLILIGINNLTAFQCLIPLRKENLFTFTVFVGAIVNFIANSILVPKFLAVGAAWGSIIAEGCVLSMELYFVRKYISLRNICKDSFKYIISGIVTYVSIKYVSHLFYDPFVILMISIIMGGVVYLYILYLLRDKFFMEFILIRLIDLMKKIKAKGGLYK